MRQPDWNYFAPSVKASALREMAEACRTGDFKNARRWLLRSDLLVEKCADGRTPLEIAAVNRHIGKIPEILWFDGITTSRDSTHHRNILHITAQNGTFRQIPRELYDKKSLLLTDRYGWTAYHHAAFNGHFSQIPANLVDSKVLLTKAPAADPTAPSTPIQCAIAHSSRRQFDHVTLRRLDLRKPTNRTHRILNFGTRCAVYGRLDILASLIGHERIGKHVLLWRGPSNEFETILRISLLETENHDQARANADLLSTLTHPSLDARDPALGLVLRESPFRGVIADGWEKASIKRRTRLKRLAAKAA